MTAIATSQSAASATLLALLQSTGFRALDQTGWIAVTGDDRVRWLNGMTTNSIQQLQPGEGNYNFLLSAQGRIQGDAYAFAQSDRVLLETDRERLAAMMELLDRFIIMDDVELKDLSAERQGLVVAGPTAAATLAGIGIDTRGLAPLSFSSFAWKDAAITVIAAYSPLVPRFELWVDTATIEALTEALSTAGATSVTAADLEHLRLLEGTPRYGVDIRDRELPQETEQTRALHFAKGCYLGQEIVERIRSRGNVHRTFHAFELAGELPAPGSALEADGKAVGELTSVALIPLPGGPRQLALGYVRREALERALPLVYPGGEASPIALPVRAVVESL